MAYDLGQKAQYQANAEPRPATEIEGVIGEIREHLVGTLSSAREIAYRVLPPTPEKASNANVSPIATTYYQKLRDVAELCDQLRGIVGELNGRI